MTAPGTAMPPCVERIVLGQTDPNVLLALCHDAVIRVFDVRNNRAPALTLQPFRQQPAGIVYEPNCRPNLLVVASERGEMCFIDVRMASSSSSSSSSFDASGGGGVSGAMRVVPAHSKGGLSTLVAHSHAPLMATGTVNQVVKVWTDHGEAVGAIRSQSSFPSTQRAGPITCMSFHAYQPLLVAASGGDSVCTVYAVDNNPNSGQQLTAASSTPGPAHAGPTHTLSGTTLGGGRSWMSQAPTPLEGGQRLQ